MGNVIDRSTGSNLFHSNKLLYVYSQKKNETNISRTLMFIFVHTILYMYTHFPLLFYQIVNGQTFHHWHFLDIVIIAVTDICERSSKTSSWWWEFQRTNKQQWWMLHRRNRTMVESFSINYRLMLTHTNKSIPKICVISLIFLFNKHHWIISRLVSPKVQTKVIWELIELKEIRL